MDMSTRGNTKLLESISDSARKVVLRSKNDPNIAYSILQHLASWSSNDTLAAKTHPRSKAETAQDHIGLDFLLEGMVSHTWSDIQTDHYVKLGMRRTGLRWMTQLLLKFWGICWDLWNIRNEWEHRQQLEEAEETIRSQVENAIHHGFSDLPNLSHIYSVQRIMSLRTSTIHYQKAWLLNLDASRKRAQRKSLPAKEIRGMQQVMRSFLQQNKI